MDKQGLDEKAYHEALVRASEEQEKELRLIVREFKQLTTTPAWGTFVRLLENHINASVEDMLREVPSVSRKELAAWVRGIRFAVALPHITLSVAQGDADTTQTQPEEGEDYE